MALLYHGKPRRVDLLTCGAVLLGVILFFVDGIQAGNLPGNIAAVVSGVCYAGVFMMNTGEKADAISSCFLGQLTAGVLLTPLCFGETDFSVPTLRRFSPWARCRWAARTFCSRLASNAPPRSQPA